MSGRFSGSTAALRDQLLAALRDADKPLTSKELSELCPVTDYTCCRRDDSNHALPLPHWKSITCMGTWDAIVYTLLGTHLRRHLDALERKGLIRGIRHARTRGVRWVTADTMEALTDKLDLPAL